MVSILYFIYKGDIDKTLFKIFTLDQPHPYPVCHFTFPCLSYVITFNKDASFDVSSILSYPVVYILEDSLVGNTKCTNLKSMSQGARKTMF